jgi:hypothetical protein
MSTVTVLASGQLTPVSTITIELHEDRDVRAAVREPAVVLIRWPEKHCMIHPAASARWPPRQPDCSPPPPPSWPRSRLEGGCDRCRARADPNYYRRLSVACSLCRRSATSAMEK